MSLFEVMFCPREIDFMSTVCKQLTVLTVAHIRAHACMRGYFEDVSVPSNV